jgi:hypothetical protein
MWIGVSSTKPQTQWVADLLWNRLENGVRYRTNG